MADMDKRERIIAAAYDVLSEQGYDRASTKEIANAAGVAQGLINYYFPSKELLFAEVFRRETDKYCGSFNNLRAYGAKELNAAVLREILRAPQERTLEEPGWFRLRSELAAIGLRSEQARLTLQDTLRAKRVYLSELIESIAHLPKEEADRLSGILLSVFDGLGLQRTADPDYDYEGAFDMLAQLLGSYLQVRMQKGSEG
jgi:AcrR family transcriptional regulator